MSVLIRNYLESDFPTKGRERRKKITNVASTVSSLREYMVNGKRLATQSPTTVWGKSVS